MSDRPTEPATRRLSLFHGGPVATLEQIVRINAASFERVERRIDALEQRTHSFATEQRADFRRLIGIIADASLFYSIWLSAGLVTASTTSAPLRSKPRFERSNCCV